MSKSIAMSTKSSVLTDYKFATAMFLAIAIYMMFASFVYASGQTPMGNVLCSVVGMFTGNLGRGLSTLAVLVVGVGATLGKVSWGLAITVAVGISVIMNATRVAGLLSNGFTAC